jgi:hypothetical protein
MATASRLVKRRLGPVRPSTICALGGLARLDNTAGSAFSGRSSGLRYKVIFASVHNDTATDNAFIPCQFEDGVDDRQRCNGVWSGDEISQISGVPCGGARRRRAVGRAHGIEVASRGRPVRGATITDLVNMESVGAWAESPDLCLHTDSVICVCEGHRSFRPAIHRGLKVGPCRDGRRRGCIWRLLHRSILAASAGGSQDQ